MLKGLLYSSLAAALTASLAPGLGHAQPNCQEQKHDNRVMGTVLGAVGGAFLGNAIGQHGGKTGGTIIGGVGGAVAGNAIGGATVNCSSNQYGYYDESGRWVPNTVTENGYYDANGRWVATTPNNYAPPAYSSPPPAYGATPAPAAPAYERPDGYPPPSGAYGQDNRYGQDYNASPPPAPPAGEYDRNTRPYGQEGGYRSEPSSPDRDQSAAYGRDEWSGAPMDTREREDWLQVMIQRRLSDGSLDDRRGRRALRELENIRGMDTIYRDPDPNHRLTPDQRRDIMDRLESLRASLSADRDQSNLD